MGVGHGAQANVPGFRCRPIQVSFYGIPLDDDINSTRWPPSHAVRQRSIPTTGVTATAAAAAGSAVVAAAHPTNR